MMTTISSSSNLPNSSRTRATNNNGESPRRPLQQSSEREGWRRRTKRCRCLSNPYQQRISRRPWMMPKWQKLRLHRVFPAQLPLQTRILVNVSPNADAQSTNLSPQNRQVSRQLLQFPSLHSTWTSRVQLPELSRLLPLLFLHVLPFHNGNRRNEKSSKLRSPTTWHSVVRTMSQNAWTTLCSRLKPLYKLT